MSELDDLQALRKRILLPFQVQKGSNVWAPWGTSGWSALRITKPRRKWAFGPRIKPLTGKEGSEGKVRKDRLLSRNPKLMGKDRPALSPDEVFAEFDRQSEEVKAKPSETTSVVSSPSPSSNGNDSFPVKKTAAPVSKEMFDRVSKLFDRFEDKSTTDDW